MTAAATAEWNALVKSAVGVVEDWEVHPGAPLCRANHLGRRPSSAPGGGRGVGLEVGDTGVMMKCDKVEVVVVCGLRSWV